MSRQIGQRHGYIASNMIEPGSLHRLDPTAEVAAERALTESRVLLEEGQRQVATIRKRGNSSQLGEALLLRDAGVWLEHGCAGWAMAHSGCGTRFYPRVEVTPGRSIL